MHRIVLTILSFLFFYFPLAAQTGTITGRITDSNNSEELIGATVSLENNKSIGTTTDIDGRFTLGGIEQGGYTLLVSYVSYNTKQIENVEVKAGEITNLDVTMESNANELDEVVVTSSFAKENINSLMLKQKNAASVSDGISADVIRKTPDKSTGDALKRVSGVTIQNGRFVVIRGLPDRYNFSTINGSPLPSTEPDRKVFSFDLIPAFLVDNIVVVKTAEPDMPGDFAGGIITINTRDVPEENFLSLSAGSSINTLANFSTWYKNNSGTTDWLGIDDGSRSLPSSFPSSENIQMATNEQLLDYSKMIPNDWAYESKKAAPLGYNWQLVGGMKQSVGIHQSLGAIAALTFNSSNKLSNFTRSDFDADGTAQYEYHDAQSKNNISWGALVNLAYNINENNRITLRNSFTLNTDNIMTVRSGQNIENAQDIQAYAYNYIENKLLTTQLEGDHYLKTSKIKIDWNVAYGKINRDQPDYRRLYYSRNIGDSTFLAYIPFGSASPSLGGKFYSALSENNYSAALNASIPFSFLKKSSSIKIGTYHQVKDRQFGARSLGYVVTDISKFFTMNADPNAILAEAPSQLFAPENIGEAGFSIDEITNPSDAYKASSDLHAYYLMFDNQLPLNLRLIWGARFEYFNQKLNSFNYINLPVDYNTKSGDFNSLPFDLLPSANLVYSLTDNANIRLAYSKTVARPEFREVAPFSFYDFEASESVIGNDTLGRTTINNFDFKIENFFGKGQIVSLSLFYKKFTDPIEQYVYAGSGFGSRTKTFVNADFATAFGVEVEFIKNLSFLSKWIHWNQFENVTFSTNLACIKSKVDQSDNPNAWTPERPLQGQSPYIINVGLTYTEPVSQLGFGVFFNEIGRRIEAVGSQIYPDVYEDSRPLLDAQISRKVFRNASVKLNFNDILAKDFLFYQDQNDNGHYDADDMALTIQEVGVNISLSFSYKF